MLGDVMLILYWWLMGWGLSMLSFPIIWLVTKHMWSGGYVMTRVIGWTLVWLASWLTVAVFGIELTQMTMLVGLAVWGGINGWLYFRNKTKIVDTYELEHERWKHVELLYVLVLVVYVLIRGYAPWINGEEKFMDLAFSNSILQQFSVPPADPWMAGQSIPYYYGGHWSTAARTWLSGLPLTTTYNLMLGTIAAQSVLAVMGLVNEWNRYLFSELKWKFWWWMSGLFMAAWFLLRGNLHWLWSQINVYWQVEWLPAINTSYLFSEATRYIPDTIHEFPLYSFVVSDLHAHLMNLPVVLVSLWILSVIVLQKRIEWKIFGLMGILSGALLLVSPYDAVLFGGLVFVSVVYLFWNRRFDRTLIKQIIWNGLIYILIAVLLAWPMYATWWRSAEGLVWFAENSPLADWLVVWGVEVVLSIGFVYLVAGYRLISWPYRVLLLWLLYAWMLLVSVELVYVQMMPDSVTVSDPRTNMVFKLTWFAWMLFSLVLGLGILKVVSIWKELKVGEKVVALSIGGILCFGYVGYLGSAVGEYYGGFEGYRGIDGGEWMSRKYPEDAAIVAWLQDQPVDLVIVESADNSFTEFGRISAYSGRATVLGWYKHEWLWRGGDHQPFTTMVEDIDLMYTTGSPEKVKELIDRYNVDVIIVGQLEQEKYAGLLHPEVLSSVASEVLEFGSSRVFVVKAE